MTTITTEDRKKTETLVQAVVASILEKISKWGSTKDLINLIKDAKTNTPMIWPSLMCDVLQAEILRIIQQGQDFQQENSEGLDRNQGLEVSLHVGMRCWKHNLLKGKNLTSRFLSSKNTLES